MFRIEHSSVTSFTRTPSPSVILMPLFRGPKLTVYESDEFQSLWLEDQRGPMGSTSLFRKPVACHEGYDALLLQSGGYWSLETSVRRLPVFEECIKETEPVGSVEPLSRRSGWHAILINITELMR